MKILVVGSDKVYAIENFYVKYLRALGESVIHYPAQSIFSDYYQTNVVNKIVFRSGLSKIYTSINKELIKIAGTERPDLVWVFKGMEIFPETLQSLKRMGVRLVNFNGDNPFLFSGRGSGNANVTESIDIYDLHLTYNSSVYREFERRKLNAAILPFGFDLDHGLYEVCTKEPEINRVCFLGNPDKGRSAFIQKLAEAGIEVAVFGNSWPAFLPESRYIAMHQPVYGEEQWRVLRKYRVQLNLMRRHNPDSHNMRTFEVPGVGGIMLAPDTPEHRTFFLDGKEAFFFRGYSECVGLARRILAFTHEQAAAVRGSARKRSVTSGYRYEDRAQQVLKLFDKCRT